MAEAEVIAPVEKLRCRLLPFTVADGPHHMAADEALLASAAAGVASLRFYGWSSATLSLGYFQPERLRQTDPVLADLPWLRRPTGGAALVHHHELTYALALPSGGSCWLCQMHHVIAAALKRFGVATESCSVERRPPPPGLLCFLHHTPGDLLLGAAKIVGSAQRRHRQALLQHGAVLLAASPFAPVLPGIQELGNTRLEPATLQEAIQEELVRQTGWELAADDWTDRERQQTTELFEERYSQDSWNRKR